MTLFLCKLWPYLAGGLIGWLLAGWFARRLKHSKPIERIVEKEVKTVVDNPEHLALISKLENENTKIPDMMAKIASFDSIQSKGGGKTIEVDNPKLLSRIKELEQENTQVASLMSKVSDLESRKPEVTEKQIKVDNPELLARIKKLEDENSQISDLQAKLKAQESAGAKAVEKQVDNPEHVKRIGTLEKEIVLLKQGPEIDLQAAKAAGIVIKDKHDLTAIEGIGPKINDLIKADGINSFRALADTNPATIQKTLDNAGSKYKMANPGTWPDQANLAANNRWPALKALQDVLIGGVYPDGSSTGGSSGNKSAASKSKSAGTGGKGSQTETPLDTDAAKTFGFKIKQSNGQVDFTLIEGIGPKINELIHAAGIHTFRELSDTYVEDIQKILDKAGSAFKMAKPGTWPAQSDMAASNRWEKLKAWQDKLDGGVES